MGWGRIAGVMHDHVESYIASAPAEQREALQELRAMIGRALPNAEPAIESGFPVYKVDGKWVAGFAMRKKGPMLYIMASGVLDRHVSALGVLRSGRSCVEYRPSTSLSMDELRSLAHVMLAEAAGTG